MQTPLQLDIWLQSYDGFDNAKNNMKQRNLNTVFANITKTTSPTSNSLLLIMSQIGEDKRIHGTEEDADITNQVTFIMKKKTFV